MIRICMIMMALFVSSQSTNAKETEKIWKEKTVWNCIKLLFYLQKLSDKEWKQKNEQKGSFYASTAADYTIIYSTFCTK